MAQADAAVIFNEPVAPVVSPPRAHRAARVADVLVAILDARTIVVPDHDGRPVAFRLGERLPSGARLLTVDAPAGAAQTDRGPLRLE